MKRFLALTLAISLSLPQFGWADDGSRALEAAPTHTEIIELTGPEGQSRMAIIQAGDPGHAFVRHYQEALTPQEQENVAFLTTSDDPVRQFLNNDDAVFVADGLADVPAIQTPLGRRFLQKIKTNYNRILGQVESPVPALIVSVSLGAGYGGATWHLSENYLQAIGAGSIAAVATAVIGMFSSAWLEHSKVNGQRLARGVASMLGRPISDRTNLRWIKMGMIGTYFQLNMVSAFAVLAVSGQMTTMSGVAKAAGLALLASSEVVEMYVERFLRGGHIRPIVWGRQIAFGIAEIAFMSGWEPAFWFTAIPVGTIMVANVFHDDIAQGLRAAGNSLVRSIRYTQTQQRRVWYHRNLELQRQFADLNRHVRKRAPAFVKSVKSKCLQFLQKDVA